MSLVKYPIQSRGSKASLDGSISLIGLSGALAMIRELFQTQESTVGMNTDWDNHMLYLGPIGHNAPARPCSASRVVIMKKGRSDCLVASYQAPIYIRVGDPWNPVGLENYPWCFPAKLPGCDRMQAQNIIELRTRGDWHSDSLVKDRRVSLVFLRSVRARACYLESH